KQIALFGRGVAGADARKHRLSAKAKRPRVHSGATLELNDQATAQYHPAHCEIATINSIIWCCSHCHPLLELRRNSTLCGTAENCCRLSPGAATGLVGCGGG